MATIREIKRRIQAVKSTQKITRAMRMVAAAKLRKAQENIIKARPYAKELESIIARVAMIAKRDTHPLLMERKDPQKILLVVVTSDSGLCGGFNANTIKAAQKYLDDNPGMKIDLFCIGKKGDDFFRRRGISIAGTYKQFFTRMKYSDAVSIIKQIEKCFLELGYDRVEMLYNEFGSAIRQVITIKQLLPLVPGEPDADTPSIDYLYEPDEYVVFKTIIPYHLEVQIWRVLLESFASEMGAKMTAMDAATDNAKDLLKTITISYNRARQALITREISEIVGGMVGVNT